MIKIYLLRANPELIEFTALLGTASRNKIMLEA